MTIHLKTQTDLDDALATLLKLDPRLAPIMEMAGTPALRQREPGFAGLATIVCGQQVSTAAAAAIWGRVSAAFDPFDPGAIVAARTDRLGRLCRSLNRSLLVSAECARRVPDKLISLGPHRLEGFDAAEEVFGLAATEPPAPA